MTKMHEVHEGSAAGDEHKAVMKGAVVQGAVKERRWRPCRQGWALGGTKNRSVHLGHSILAGVDCLG